ncbi:MAG TPA: type II toxin-antitoxin system VapC family toxin [Rhizomicrobium sp.]|jgi:PIN domain nuclease of toxin-antitoxin system
MGRYLLDSNAFIRAKDEPHKLSQEARKTIEDETNQIFISLASLWEMAIKAANDKLPFHAQTIAGGATELLAVLRESNFALLGIEMNQVLAAAALPQHHRDPFDRLMIAQALEGDLTIITADAAFARYRGVRILLA